MRSRLLAALLAAPLAGAALLLGAPADAAVKTVTISWDGSKFTSTPTIASGDIVKWTNNGGPLDGTLTISYKSGPTKFTTSKPIQKGSSASVTMNGGPTKSDEVVT